MTTTFHFMTSVHILPSRLDTYGWQRRPRHDPDMDDDHNCLYILCYTFTVPHQISLWVLLTPMQCAFHASRSPRPTYYSPQFKSRCISTASSFHETHRPYFVVTLLPSHSVLSSPLSPPNYFTLPLSKIANTPTATGASCRQ